MNLPAPGARSMPLMVQLSQLRHRWGFALLLLMGCVTLTLLVFAPLYTLLSKSVENKAGEFVGLANFAQYLGSSAFESAFFNSLWVASLRSEERRVGKECRFRWWLYD